MIFFCIFFSFKVNLREICLTILPDLKYLDLIDPHRPKIQADNSENSNLKSPSTQAGVKVASDRFCQKLEKLEFDLDSKFEEFIAKYDKSSRFKSLSLDQNIETIEVENQMNEYLKQRFLLEFFNEF